MPTTVLHVSYLGEPPFFILLLQPSHDYGDDRERVLEHIVGNLTAFLGAIDLLQHSLID